MKSEPKKLDGGDPSPEGEELERVETWNDGEPPSGPPQSTLHTGEEALVFEDRWMP